jgi:adenosylhomocysteine nucleosidase
VEGTEFLENGDAVLICGGIGAAAARRAAEALVVHANPRIVLSIGFAGALRPKQKVGDVAVPAEVLDAVTGGHYPTQFGAGVLLSVGEIANVEQKRALGNHFGADAVDMEAAAVAEVAMRHSLPFAAVKAISDGFEFRMPPLEGFVDRAGKFHETRFAIFAALRPWLWPSVVALASHTSRASVTLSQRVQHLIKQELPKSTSELVSPAGSR